jgi:hypothetical protein
LPRAFRVLGAFVALALALPASAPARAQSTGGPNAAHEKTLREESAYLDNVERRLKARELDAAASLLASFAPTTAYGRLHATFLRGVLAQLSGKTAEAIATYRSILNANPKLSRVRIQLADALTKAGDNEGAGHQVDLLAAEAGQEDVADRLRSIANRLKKQKRWYLRANLSALPTTNMNNAPASPYLMVGNMPLTLDPKYQHKSGIGANYGFDAGGSLPVADGVNMIAAASVNNMDFRGKSYDDRVTRLSIGPQFYSGPNYVGFEPFAVRRWYGGERYSIAGGGKVYSHFALPDGQRTNFSVSVSRQIYDKLSYQNGWHGGFEASLDTFATASSFWRIGATTDYDHTHKRHLDYAEGGVNVGHYRELPWGVSIFPQIGLAYRQYIGVFPLTESRRKDRRLAASLTLTKRDWIWYGFAPRLIYTFVLNRSNVSLYQYTRHDVRLSMVRDF